eukprot:PITA_18927
MSRLISLAYFVAFTTSCVILCSVAVAEAAAAGHVPLRKAVNLTEAETNWQPATGTWYGDANGDGSDGGACGYKILVKRTPFQSKVAAVSSDLFKEGKGCGACYQVKCTGNSLCSETGVSVVITDRSPGETHFDLSGTAFGDMASDPTRAGDLRNAGTVYLLFRRVPCEYPGMNIAFQVNQGSSAYWFEVLIIYQGGDGDLGAVYLQQAKSNSWLLMQQTWGANWALRPGFTLQPPFSFRLSTLSTGKTVTATNVVPQNWQAGATYSSVVNFD